MTFSEPQAQVEVNDDGEYKMEDKGGKNVKDDNNDNKIFFSKLQAQSKVNDDNDSEDNKEC